MPKPRHKRSEIECAALARLTGRTLAAGHVYRQRTIPLSDDGRINAASLPAIHVQVRNESVERVDITQDRRIDDLLIDCYATGQNASDDLDVFVEQVEILMRHDQTLGGTLEWLRFKSIEWIPDEEADSLIQVARITYEAKYLKPTYSDLALHSLDEVAVVINQGDETLTQTIEVTQ